jgi:hypothetical protein
MSCHKDENPRLFLRTNAAATTFNDESGRKDSPPGRALSKRENSRWTDLVQRT